MSDLTPRIENALNPFGTFSIVRWVAGGGAPSILTIKSEATQSTYTHYIGFTESASILSEIQNWMERFVKLREKTRKEELKTIKNDF